MHPRSKQRHLIDLAICLRGDIRDLEVTKVMREAECWTDHHLVNSVLTMHTIPTHHKKKIIRSPFIVSKLTNISHKKQFAQDLVSPSVLKRKKSYCTQPMLPLLVLVFSVEGTKLKTVEDLKYLTRIFFNDGPLDKEINARILKASQALSRLRMRVLRKLNIRYCSKS
ncbi:hypothetical protein ElyMa_004416700 [Elysia marginata]|uniref:Uncharacterized protein n=1 Tax=Elysia marginata TaxID=1093978 RepID=A0AAV4HDQ2_9GAST|nr:hypothetical protein ElyMa_004416700 [Elysia marginata]